MKMDCGAFQLLLMSSTTHCCGWIPVFPPSRVLWKKCKVCWGETHNYPEDRNHFSGETCCQSCQTFSRQPPVRLTQPRLWSKGRTPSSSWRWLWFLTSSASFSSSSGSSHLWVSGTFLCCPDLCWFSSAWCSGYSGTWGISLCLRRSWTWLNKTYCNYSMRDAGLESALGRATGLLQPSNMVMGRGLAGQIAEASSKIMNLWICGSPWGFASVTDMWLDQIRARPGTHLTNPRR